MSDSHRGWFPSRRELTVLVLLGLPMLVTASTIEAAHWVDGLPSLKALVFAPLLMWAYLARSRVPWWIGHPVGILAGLVIAFLLGASTISETRGASDLAGQIGEWFGSLGSRGGDGGEPTMGFGLIAITLWMGHFTVWLAYRRTFALLAVLPGLAVLLVVLTFLPTSFYWYFFMYLLAAAPGIAYRNMGRWSVGSRRVQLAGSLVAGLVLMGATLVSVWRTPAPDGIVLSLESRLGDSWYSFSGALSDVFYDVPSRKDWPFFSPPLDLPFGGPIEPGDDLMFVVDSPDPYRWRLRVYDTYTSTGWTSQEPPLQQSTAQVPLPDYVDGLKARKQVTIGVRLYTKSNTLVTVGEPVAAGVPSKVELSPQPGFTMYLEGTQVSYLPPEVEEQRAKWTHLLDWSQLPTTDLIDLGYNVVLIPGTGENGEEGRPDPSKTPRVLVERVQPTVETPLALLGERILVPVRQYRTTGSISQASPSMLRRAGEDYPNWVTDRYLQLPNDFPQTVIAMSRLLTAEEDNAHDKAEAIRRHLITLPYSLDIKLPPPGKDWVEFFLLEERRGYCQNYASAMITMLRSIGIPSRLVVGFAPGIPDENREEWTVQSRHYHAWPEVYFPGYGWFEFEPTPADVQDALQPLGIRPLGGLERDRSQQEDDCFEELFGNICLDENQGQSIEDLLLEPPDPNGGDPFGDPSGGGIPGYLTSPFSLLGLGVFLALVGTVTYVSWSMNRLGYVIMAYGYMGFLGRLAGVSRRPQDTPWEYCARLTRIIPDQAESFANVTRHFVDARYGYPNVSAYAQEMWSLRAAWSTVRNALMRRILLRMMGRRSQPRPSA